MKQTGISALQASLNMYLRPSRFETETARVVAEIHSDSLSIFILEASSLSSDCNGELGIERSSLSVDHMDDGGAR